MREHRADYRSATAGDRLHVAENRFATARRIAGGEREALIGAPLPRQRAAFGSPNGFSLRRRLVNGLWMFWFFSRRFRLDA